LKLYPRPGLERFTERCFGLYCPVLTGSTGFQIWDSNLNTNNHGVSTGYSTPAQPWTGSQFGQVLDYNGTTNSSDLGTIYGDNLSVFSISIWVLNKTMPGNNSARIILGWGNNDIAAQGIFLKVSNSSGTIRFVIQKNQSGSSNITTVLPIAGVWQHLVLNVIGNRVIFYTNGLLNLDQSFGAAVQASTSLFLGGRAGNQSCDMQMAELKFYGRSQTPEDVRLDYQVMPGGLWQREPVRNRLYFAKALNLTTRRSSSRFLTFPG